MLDLGIYVIPAVMPLIFLVGVIGNVTLIFVFLRHSDMHTATNTYVFSLAVGNLLAILLCLPSMSMDNYFYTYPFNELICKVSRSVEDLWLGSTAFTLTALSADHYMSLFYPTRTGRGRATRFTVIILISIWTYALFCAIPTFFITRILAYPYVESKEFRSCFPFAYDVDLTGVKPEPRTITKLIIYYAIPLCVICCFYLLRARHVKQSTSGEIQELRQLLARSEADKMVLVFVILFAVCFLPLQVDAIWTYSDWSRDYNIYTQALFFLSLCMYFLYTCLNPIAMYFVNSEFRQHLNLLCCWFRPGDDDVSGSKSGESRLLGADETSLPELQTRPPLPKPYVDVKTLINGRCGVEEHPNKVEHMYSTITEL